MTDATPPTKAKAFLDPIKEAKAVSALRATLADHGLADDPDWLIDAVEGETSLLEAIDRLLLNMAENDGLAKGAESAAAELLVRAKRFEKRAEAARAMIEQALMIAEIENITRPAGTLFLSRRAPKVEIQDEADIPAEFWKTGDPRLDRKALLAALKDGQAVPGACLSNQAPSLSIRTA